MQTEETHVFHYKDKLLIQKIKWLGLPEACHVKSGLWFQKLRFQSFHQNYKVILIMKNFICRMDS